MDQVINLDRDDDVLKVHSKVEWSDGRRVILVVPRGAKAFDSEHELHLVRRWADDADVMVALVTNDLGVREMAHGVGLPYFPSLERAQRAQWKWLRNDDGGITRPTALDDGEPLPRESLLDGLGLAGIQLFVTLVLFAVAATVLAVVAILLVPSARITITPASLSVTDSREVILDPTVTTIDQINGIIPATSFQRAISGTASIATTKLNTAPADHAEGSVVFTNLAGTSATIAPGTIVETSSGVTVRFSTTIMAELPAGYNARVAVPIRAMDPGPAGNVKPLQINIIEGPLSSAVRVVNTAATGGGTIKQVHVVSFGDKTTLRQRLGEQLRAAAIAKLQNQAGSDVYVPPPSVQVSVLSESFDHLVDDPADVLSLHVEAVAIGMSIDLADLKTFGDRILGDKIPKGYKVLPGTLRVEPDVNARVEGNAVIFRLDSSVQTTPEVQSAEVLKGLAGKSLGEAAALIASRVRLSEPPRIEVSPSSWGHLPFFDFRIAFFVQPEPQARAP
jgi:baseplate J-like protein